jgi:hypothetical protein
MKMEAMCCSEMAVDVHRIMRPYVPDGILSCSSVGQCRRFGGSAGSVTFVHAYHTPLRYIPGEFLHSHSLKNLKHQHLNYYFPDVLMCLT